MKPDDVSTVIAIERLSFPTPWSASSFLYELNHNTLSSYYVLSRPATGKAPSLERGWRHWLRGVVGIPRESRVIGYVGFRLQHAGVHISTIAVHPDWRGNGLGELLLLTAMEQALRLEAGMVSLEVRALNQVAQRLYHKYGFRFKEIHRGYYRNGEDAWLMEAQVNPVAYRAQLTRLRRALDARLRWQQIGVGQNDGDGL